MILDYQYLPLITRAKIKIQLKKQIKLKVQIILSLKLNSLCFIQYGPIMHKTTTNKIKNGKYAMFSETSIQKFPSFLS